MTDGPNAAQAVHARMVLQEPAVRTSATSLQPICRSVGAATAHGSPMTCRARSGRRFVVIATGFGADAALVVFALSG